MKFSLMRFWYSTIGSNLKREAEVGEWSCLCTRETVLSAESADFWVIRSTGSMLYSKKNTFSQRISWRSIVSVMRHEGATKDIIVSERLKPLRKQYKDVCKQRHKGYHRVWAFEANCQSCPGCSLIQDGYKGYHRVWAFPVASLI